jgi:predicted ATP-dependent serine protease
MRKDTHVDDEDLPVVSTGNAGLDDILGGGIDPERMYLFEGQPGWENNACPAVFAGGC